MNDDRPWIFLPSWMNLADAEEWDNKIKQHLTWDQPLVRVYGSSYLVPRLTTFLAEDNISYCYSGFVHHGYGWPDWFYPLLEMVNFTSGVKYNGCLVNFYRNGNDRMGWHADNEPELDSNKPISSLSFGATRDFVLRNNSKKITHKLSLKTGDLLIMLPNCQKDWVHSLPIRKRVFKHRINLTFRCYK